jgi:glycerophosphoryl diester phosphodiesterase
MRKFILSLLFLIPIFFLLYLPSNKNNQFNNFEKNHVFFAHRGVPYLAENSDASFSESLRIGFTALETDIQITKDQKLIVFHDNNVKRLLGLDLNVNDCNWNDIKDLKILNNGFKTSNSVLLIDDLLKNYSDFNLIYLDIKVNPSKRIADELILKLEQNQSLNNFLIADSNILFLAYLKFKNHNIKTVLEGYSSGKEWVYYLIPVKYRPDFLASFYNDIDTRHISFLKEHDLIKKKIVYGINHNQIPTAINEGLYHFITDYNADMDSLIFSVK